MTKIALLFPGQGAQSIGMAKPFLDAVPAAKSLFDSAADILGYDLLKLCTDGPVEKLDSTAVSQPAIFVTSLAALEVLRLQKPDVVASASAAAGLSLGEYTALVFAGALSFEQGVRLVKERGEAMQAAADASPSTMLSILGLDREKIETICQEAKQPGEVLQIANLLCPGNIVVSGHKPSCAKAAELATAAGAMKTIPLAVAGAFHTPIMAPASDRLAKALSNTTFTDAKIPVTSNVDAAAHTQSGDFSGLLVKQLVSPVQWDDSMRALINDGYETMVEVGPGRVLRGLMNRIGRELKKKIAVSGVVD
jgi:[acyl-carrier-protein] S-malonyltransferase